MDLRRYWLGIAAMVGMVGLSVLALVMVAFAAAR